MKNLLFSIFILLIINTSCQSNSVDGESKGKSKSKEEQYLDIAKAYATMYCEINDLAKENITKNKEKILKIYKERGTAIGKRVAKYKDIQTGKELEYINTLNHHLSKCGLDAMGFGKLNETISELERNQ